MEIILLIGKTAVGKDTIRNLLLKKFDLNTVISYTTRPKRLGETDGVDYYFVNDGKMNQLIHSPECIEHTEYNVNNTLYRYCLIEDLFKENKINICIVNPYGLKEILKKFPLKSLHVIYLDLYKDIIRKRYYDREEGEDFELIHNKLEQRMIQDNKDFENLETFLKENKVQYFKYLNFNSLETTEKIINDLKLKSSQ